MTKHYYAVRPVSMPEHIRIEHADTPLQATAQAFGRPVRLGGLPSGYEVKDLGTRVSVLHSDKKRHALLTSAEGWVTI